VWLHLEAPAKRAHLHGQPTEIQRTGTMAESVGTMAAVLGLADVIIRAFGHVKSAVHDSSKQLGETVDRIFNSCRDVQRIAELGKTFNIPTTVMDCVEINSQLVSKIAEI
jgi:hypothetical protein